MGVVHSNVWGLQEIESLGDCRYYVTFIDDHMSKVQIYFIARAYRLCIMFLTTTFLPLFPSKSLQIHRLHYDPNCLSVSAFSLYEVSGCGLLDTCPALPHCQPEVALVYVLSVSALALPPPSVLAVEWIAKHCRT